MSAFDCGFNRWLQHTRYFGNSRFTTRVLLVARYAESDAWLLDHLADAQQSRVGNLEAEAATKAKTAIAVLRGNAHNRSSIIGGTLAYSSSRKEHEEMSTGLSYAVVEAWEQLPTGYRHRSVSDVAVDSRDRIYLFTRDHNRVIVFERDGSFVTSWGDGRYPGRAHGITIGPDDSVYCVNDADHTVRKFTPTGELLMTLGTSGMPSDTGYDKRRKTLAEKTASVVRGGPPFNRPTRVAVTPSGELYVADGYGNARVHRFSADGRLMQSWGEPGTGPGQFVVPHGIAVAADGRVMVADRDNDRIQIFTSDGEYLQQWTGLSRPTSLFIDRMGLVYVSEIGWEFDPGAVYQGAGDLPLRVSVFDGNGSVLARWESADSGGLGEFAGPHGLCVDSHGDLYLASNNTRGRTDSSPVRDGFTPVDYTLQKFAREI